eukprot:CAMPEP_0116036682 /NCGR_PEP_ID=MMETSP0321-20121206/21402_1 /TAXON_ID=163516 /ORGANISM="Leptocylindrus danicus var. danicus, Strain B650" /LENGTH=353 /DNA_ID=CAMNT_0003514339 /DNA_START=176 /DNA_END=1237 /DNA_ORIENTATION=+
MKRLYMLGLAAVIVSILCVIRMHSVFSGQYTFSRQISKDIRIPYKPIIDPADVSTLMSNLATMDRPYHTWNESEMLLRKGGTTMATSLLRELESLNGTHPWHCFVLHNGQIYSTEATAHSYNLMSSYQIDRGMDVLQGLSTMISLGNALRTKDPSIDTMMDIINSPDHPGIPLLHLIEDFGGCIREFPVYTFDKKINCAAYWPTIDYDIWKRNRISWKLNRNTRFKSISDVRKYYGKQQRKYPWEKKIRKAVWRGSSTGNAKNWRDLPRSKLVNASALNLDILDVGYYMFLQRSDKEVAEMEREFGTKERISMESFQRYMAVIDIDGNAWSSRFPTLLCQNSVVLKVDYMFDT